MARRKNTIRFDPRYFMDEKTEKPITEARINSVHEMKIGFADGYFYDTPGYKYDEDLAKRSESYREGYREGQEQRERDEVLDKEDAEDERLSALDDHYAELEAAPLDPQEEWEQEDRYRSQTVPYKRVGKCVYKKKRDGTKGEKVGCSQSVEKAKKYLKKLYSVEEIVREEIKRFLNK